MRSELVLLVVSLLALGAARCPHGCRKHGTCDGNTCVCNANWTGTDCSLPDVELHFGDHVNNTVSMNSWAYYHVSLLEDGQEVTFHLEETNSGPVHDCDMYVQVSTFPTKRSYFDKDTGFGGDATIKVNSSAPRGIWYLGVFGFLGCSFTLDVTAPKVACPNGCSNHGTCAEGNCTCQSGWGGADCSLSNQTLVSGTALNGHVEREQWSFFYYDLSNNNSKVVFTMDSDKDCDLYVRASSFPDMWTFDYVNASVPLPNSRDVSTVTMESPPSGRWYAGVYGFQVCSFSLRVDVTAYAGSYCANNCSMHGTCGSGVCHCIGDYNDTTCSTYMPSLPLTNPPAPALSGFVDVGEWNWFHIDLDTENTVHISVNQSSADGDCDLYAQAGERPSRLQFDLADLGNAASMTLAVERPGQATWHIGVFGWKTCAFTISVAEVIVAQGCVHGTPSGDSCQCDAGYFGTECDVQPIPLDLAHANTGSVQPGQWLYYSLTASSVAYTFAVVESASQGAVQLYVQYSDVPNEKDFAAKDTSRKASHHVLLEANATSTPRVLIAGVFGNPNAPDGQAASFTISAFAFPM